MFTKLLKYEFRSVSGILSILSLAALGAGVLGGGVLWFLRTSLNSGADSNILSISILLCVPLLLACFFGVFAYVVATFILLFARFYSHKFTDQGYLTFTLPVSCHQLLLSSLLNILLWGVLCILVVCLDVVLVLFIGVPGTNPFEVLGETIRDILTFSSDVFPLGVTSYTILTVLLSIISFLRFLILPTLSITIGALAVKKHKVLAAFGIYWGIGTVISMITNSFGIFQLVIFGSSVILENSALSNVFLLLILPMLIDLAVVIGGYFLMEYLMRNRLNLP